MATKWKGKYRGPDALKGDKDTLAAWRKAGRPKNIDEFLKGYNASKPAFKGKYPGPDEFEGDADAISGWKAAGKDDLYTQAWGLSKSKYAPVLKELELNAGTNTRLYDSAANQSKAAIDRAIGSINAARASGQKQIGDLGAGNQSLYQQAMAQSQENTKGLLSKVGENASGLLSSLQAEIKARGGSLEDYAYLSPVTRNADQTSNIVAAVGEQNRGALEQQAGLDRSRTTSLQAMADMVATTGASQARGRAQGNMDELYNKWLERQEELSTAKVKTGLERNDYTNNTFLTLKKERELRKQEEAQLNLERYMAGLKNSQEMARLASSDYFKEANLRLREADLQLKGRDLDNRIKKAKRDGDLAEARLLEQIRNNNAKNRREDAKAGVTYTPPKYIAKP